MAARRFHHTDWLWLTLVLALFGLQFWFPRLGSGNQNDTYSASAVGKKALYLLAQRQVWSAERNIRPLVKLVTGDLQYEENTTLCILGPARPPNDAEWDALLDWLWDGGRLIYAVRDGDEEFEIPRLGIRALTADDAGAQQFAPSTEQLRLGDLPVQLGDDERFALRPGLPLTAPAAVPILVYNNEVRAVRQRWGAGTVVVLDGDSVFSNASLAYEDNPLLAWRLIEAAGRSVEIVFDESLNESATPKALAILFAPTFRPITLHLLTLVCLYGWWRSHRFGPRAAAVAEPRRNIVDHTDTVGNLLYQKKNGAYPLRIYLRQLIAELRLKQHKGHELRVLAPIASRLGRSPEEVLKALEQAAKAARSPHLDRKTAGKIINRLARIRRARGSVPRQKVRSAD